MRPVRDGEFGPGRFGAGHDPAGRNGPGRKTWAPPDQPGYGVETGNEEQTLAGWWPVIWQMAAVM